MIILDQIRLYDKNDRPRYTQSIDQCHKCGFRYHVFKLRVHSSSNQFFNFSQFRISPNKDLFSASSVRKMKGKRNRTRKVQANFNHDCGNGIECSNCTIKFKNVFDFNAHTSLCNFKLGLTAPEINESHEHCTLYPKFSSINFQKLLTGPRDKMKNSKNFRLEEWLRRDVGLSSDICESCGNSNCSTCRGVECKLCGHYYCLLLLRNGSNFNNII